MLERLTLRNFKAHRETVVGLRPLTVLVGPNGSGKTSVLDALHYLGQLYAKSGEDLFRGPRDPEALVRRVGGAASFSLLAEGKSGGTVRSLFVDASAENEPSFTQDGEEYEAKRWYFPRTITAEGKVIDLASGPRSLAQEGYGDHWPELRNCVLLRLDARRVAASSPGDPFARVGFDGAGVATVLANLKLTDEARFDRIVSDVARVVPQVERVRSVPASVRDGASSVAGFRLVFDVRGGTDVPATSMSEGTLVVVALMTILNGPRAPRMVLLDDVDEALHPSAQARLMHILADVTTGDEPVQVVATSHSPYVLDCVEPEAVQVFALRQDGTVAVRCLAEHPDAERYRGALSAGQLWTLDDEQAWVVEGAA